MTPAIPDDVDAWPYVSAEIPAAWEKVRRMFNDPPAGFLQLAEARYRAGEREYKREWLTRRGQLDWAESEALQELVDLVTYFAMDRVLHPDSGTF